MARTTTDGRGFYLDVTGNDTGGWVLMIDNLGSPGVTAESHQFAGVVIDGEDKRGFIADLAATMGVEVSLEAPRASEWNDAFGVSTEAVQVHDYQEEFDPGDWDGKRYCVSGDIGEFLTEKEEDQLLTKWGELMADDLSSWSANYKVADLLAAGATDWTDFDLEPEGMCFFLYTDNKRVAEDIAQWINGKEFLK